MSREEARAHVRAAQEAELAGNKAGAVAHLERAALEYVRVGANGKAVAMYTYCLKLQPDRSDLKDALAKAESWASGESPVEREAAKPPLEAALMSRGPVLASSDMEAWCSFCCQPGRDVGRLVQGPAGAYICKACVEASGLMLGAGPTPLPGHLNGHATSGAASSPAPAPAPGEIPDSGWLGPAILSRFCRAALAGRVPPVVVVGPEGSGKSALLRSLGESAAPVDLALDEPIPAGSRPLLLDHLESVRDPAVLNSLKGRPFVAALRAESRLRTLWVKSEQGETGIPTCEVELPAALPFAVALSLPEPDRSMLAELLARALSEKPGRSLAPKLGEALIVRALKSGRGAKALLGELRLALEIGEGSLDLAIAERKPPRKRPRAAP